MVEKMRKCIANGISAAMHFEFVNAKDDKERKEALMKEYVSAEEHEKLEKQSNLVLAEWIVMKEKYDKLMRLKKGSKVLCCYCNKPIHIDKFAGVSKKGFICNDTCCLTELAKGGVNGRKENI